MLLCTLALGCIARQKRGEKIPKRPTGPSLISECPSPIVPIPFAMAAAPPGVQIMPSVQPKVPISRSQHVKCHQSAVQGFSLYQLDALQAKRKARNPQNVQLVPHSSASARLDWSRFLLQWLRRPLGCAKWRDASMNYISSSGPRSHGTARSSGSWWSGCCCSQWRRMLCRHCQPHR